MCVLAVAVPRSSRGYLGERIREWEGHRGLSFLENMELRGGELLVPRAGLYYIYGQTYFRLPSSGEAEGGEEEAQLVQYIYKKVRLCASTTTSVPTEGQTYHKICLENSLYLSIRYQFGQHKCRNDLDCARKM